MAREAGLGARGSLTLVLVLALLAVGLAAGSPADAGATTCTHARARPGTVSLGKLRGAMDCLVNKARAKKGVHRLRPDSDLDSLAQAHTRLMDRFDCFRHQCRKEPTLRQRFKQSDYVKGASSFRYSEELGYESTPKQMIERLLSSRSHRRNILSSSFRDLGVGVHRGAPVAHVSDHKFMTYTLELGALQK